MTPAFVWPVRAEPESEPAPRILLVDDAPESLRLLVAALGGHCELLVATSGAEALECIRREPGLDLVVLDITMPDLDGHEVLAWLREEYPDRRLPVIFVTAIDDEQAQTTGFALGAVDYTSSSRFRWPSCGPACRRTSRSGARPSSSPGWRCSTA